MKKLNTVIYQKLFLQAEEAKDQGMTKLASGIFNAIGPTTEDEHLPYNYDQLRNDIYQEMWKLASHVIKYHDVESADAEKIHDRLETLAQRFVEDVEEALGVDPSTVGPLETKLPGETD